MANIIIFNNFISFSSTCSTCMLFFANDLHANSLLFIIRSIRLIRIRTTRSTRPKSLGDGPRFTRQKLTFTLFKKLDHSITKSAIVVNLPAIAGQQL
jgi:hypothetical protein